MPSSESAEASQPSKNAVSHGFYTDDIVLATENPDEFNALHQALREEYCPDGTSEEAAVFDIANMHWKKRRLNRTSKRAADKCEADALADASSDDLKDLAKGMRAAEILKNEAFQYTYSGFCKKLQELYKPDASAESKQNTPQELEKLAVFMKEMNILGGMVPTHQIVEKHNLDQTGREQDRRADIMEKELKIHAHIDREIDKAIKRLVMIKEYKKLYAPKSMEKKQIEQNSLPAQLLPMVRRP